MKKYKIIALAMLVCAGMKGYAQDGNVTGKVVDKTGNPVEGALVFVESNPQVQVATDKNGQFEIAVEKGKKIKVLTWDDATKVVPVTGDKIMTIVMDFSTEHVNYGFGLKQNRAESTGAVSTVYAEKIDNRSAMNVGNTLYGNVTGLTTMQKTANIWEQIPSMTIRGLQTLNSNNGILLLVDEIGRHV